MSNTYKIGASTGQINLAVTMSAVGLAASQANILNSEEILAQSTDNTGDIDEQSIGSAASLAGKQLTIYTRVALSADNATDRENDANAIQGRYTLSGGDDGTQTLTGPVVSYNDPNADVYFMVTLK